MNLSVDSTVVDNTQQQQQQTSSRQNLNLLLLHQMYQPLVSGKIYEKFMNFLKSINFLLVKKVVIGA